MNWRSQWKRRKSVTRQLSASSVDPPSVYLSLWELWTKQSDDRELVVDWSKIVRKVNKKPSVAMYSDEARRGMLLLHFVCALYPPLEAVETILNANPRAVYHKSLTAGITPLMIACGRSASPEVIRLLLRRQARETIDIRDSSGYTAIHWACRADVGKEVVRTLLILNPQVATRRVQAPDGRMSHTSGATCLDILSQGRASNRFSPNQWDKLCYILWARHYGTLVARSGQAFSTLHAALALHCQKYIIDIVLERHGAQSAGVRDKFGNLPLHYAVRIHSLGAILATLLQHFPLAASRPDSDDRLPLMMALKHGYTWQQGVRELYSLYPMAISMIDDDTSLFPFSLAATSSDVETIYCLLREHPQMISGMNPGPHSSR
jgi:ankyrin repeat protein